MDVYFVRESGIERLDHPEAPLPVCAASTFYWFDASHDEVQNNPDAWRDRVEQLSGTRILDLHLLDATNLGHPSYFDSTRDYEMVVFRKLAVGETVEESGAKLSVPARKGMRVSMLSKIATRPVTFFLFDRALVTVSARSSRTIEQVRRRLLDLHGKNGDRPLAEGASSHQGRLPLRPEDLMLRLLNAMVDRYLELRQPLTDQLDRWQRELLDERRGFHDWSALLDARIELRKLENLCEEQHDALQEFRDNLIDSIETAGSDPLKAPASVLDQRRADILLVRINDIMEHISRVMHHARRLQDSIESAIQLHFSATAHRTNQIVRTLTVITAIFAPLTLITGIFGMNFENMPALKHPAGFWVTIGSMVVIAVSLLAWFKLKRYLDDRPRS